MLERKLSREQIAERAAQELPEGAYVNLGWGIPNLIAAYVPDSAGVIFHSENGILGMGPRARPGEEDFDLVDAMKAPVKLEMELEDLPSADRQVFMRDLGLTEFSRSQALRTIYDAMGRMVFFTVGEDECRAWGLSKGDDAVTGAAQIHTDLARGFVRAEVVGYEDFRRVGSMKEAKTHGVYRLESKTYKVQDGDIMHILSST